MNAPHTSSDVGLVTEVGDAQSTSKPKLGAEPIPSGAQHNLPLVSAWGKQHPVGIQSFHYLLFTYLLGKS